MDSPTNGEYYFEYEDVLTKKYKQLSEFRNRKIGFVFQSFNLSDDCTVAEKIEMPLEYAGVNKVQRRERVRAILDEVGLADKEKNFPHQLSVGQQRVVIAMALINVPFVILADESTGNLDTKNAA